MTQLCDFCGGLAEHSIGTDAGCDRSFSFSWVRGCRLGRFWLLAAGDGSGAWMVFGYGWI